MLGHPFTQRLQQKGNLGKLSRPARLLFMLIFGTDCLCYGLPIGNPWLSKLEIQVISIFKRIFNDRQMLFALPMDDHLLKLLAMFYAQCWVFAAKLMQGRPKFIFLSFVF